MRAVSAWAVSVGAVDGAVVALLMPGGPDYVAVWLGITRVGGVVALLNTQLPAEGLRHCLGVVRPAHVVTAGLDVPEVGVRVWEVGEVLGGSLDRTLTPTLSRRERELDRPALLIFTSGTTGLPKAAVVTHARVMEWSLWFSAMMDVTPADRTYVCLPLYHSVGGVLAVGAALVAGGCVVIRDRFSASRFWDDVVERECTIFAYIGELCRYLLAAAPHPREATHRLRLVCGNGLAADVWAPFQARFAVPRVLEFYAATEGALSLTNVEGRVGAVGRIPGYLAARFPVALLRLDGDIPVRDAAGRCVLAGPDEPGEAVSRLERARDFYTDPAANARKLVRDVVVPGDVWFRSGDLLRRDRAGFYYFVDRLGDTFRWKGENVSTTEVTAVLMACPGVVAAVVYGVAVPGHEGRAGMAALMVGPVFSWPVLAALVGEKLPAYARPVFVRVCERLETTGTFKPVKAGLVEEGWTAADRVRLDGHYVLLEPELRGGLGGIAPWDRGRLARLGLG